MPFADGGSTTTDNLQLRCRAHNAFEAKQYSDSLLVRERPMRYQLGPDRVGIRVASRIVKLPSVKASSAPDTFVIPGTLWGVAVSAGSRRPRDTSAPVAAITSAGLTPARRV